MPELLRVKGGSPPCNIITDRIVSINEILELFGSDPDIYMKHRGSRPLDFCSGGDLESVDSCDRYVVILIKEEEIDPTMFPEAGCYVVKDCFQRCC